MTTVTIDEIAKLLNSGDLSSTYLIQNVADPTLKAKVDIPYPAVMPPYSVQTSPVGVSPDPKSMVCLILGVVHELLDTNGPQTYSVEIRPNH